MKRLLLGTTILVAVTLPIALWARSDALDKARAAYTRRDLHSAYRYAREHLRHRPWSHEAALLAARSLSNLGNPAAAETFYTWARRMGPLDLKALHDRAWGFTCADDRERAILAYNEILRREPEDRIALRRLATLYYSRKQYEQARAIAERLCRYPDTAVVGYAVLGTLSHDRSDPRGASAWFEKVLELDPDLSALPYPASFFWDELTDDLIATGKATEARALLIRASSRRDEASLHWQRAKVEKALGDVEESEACCRRALDRDPRLKDAWLLRGQIALRRDRREEARTCLENASMLAPDDLETAYALHSAYRTLGSTEDARRMAKKVEKLRARAPSTQRGMGTPVAETGQPHRHMPPHPAP